MQLYVHDGRVDHDGRVALTPETTKRLQTAGCAVHFPSGLGNRFGWPDEAFENEGAQASDELANAQIVIGCQIPDAKLVERLPRNSLYIGLLDPFFRPELISAFGEKSVNAFCMELVPRSTIAQKMDALSSQASLAGYQAVLAAAEHSAKGLPMMNTAAGTIKPARALIIGAGVAGLQAIATAKRLGARVEAYDTRPVVEEQVRSLGAKFLKLDIGETEETDQGYAKALSEEQLARQREQLGDVLAGTDILITTAQVFGRRAPTIVTRAMVERMRPGSVIVDLAAATGGNVEGSEPRKTVNHKGVHIIGAQDLAASVAEDASRMYASNIAYVIEHLVDGESGELRFDFDDDITHRALLVHEGEVRNEEIRNQISSAKGN